MVFMYIKNRVFLKPNNIETDKRNDYLRNYVYIDFLYMSFITSFVWVCVCVRMCVYLLVVINLC